MAAPMVHSAIENYVNGFDDTAAVELCQSLIQKAVALVDIIETLGEFLTCKETSTRARGTRLLADILNQLPQDFLSSNEASMLAVYLCERLSDHHSLQPHALYGLLALSNVSVLPGNNVETICRTFFRDVHTQSMPQTDRRSVFTILLNFLHNHLAVLTGMGSDFVYGYIQAMDAEKDPRNLVLAFHCAQLVIQNFSLGVFVEEMFEVVSCYFPIDFSPPPNDPSGIKKEDLILGLRNCLASTPKFAQYCLPLLMEKVTSDLKSAKIDSLQTLAVCTYMYGSESLQEFQTAFFNCIKKEVFMSNDVAVEEAALTALRALVRAASTGILESDTKSSLESFVEEILIECKQHLLQPELMLMLSTGRLLQAAALGSSSACCQILQTTIPLLVETHNKQTQPTARHNVVKVLVDFVHCTSNFNYNDKNPNPVAGKTSYIEHLLSIYLSSLDDDYPSLQLLGVRGLHGLVSLSPDVLCDGDSQMIASKLVQTCLNKDTETSVWDACSETIRYQLSHSHTVVENQVIPTVFSALKSEKDAVKKGTLSSIMDLLASITVHVDVVKKVMQELCSIHLYTTESIDDYRATTKCLATIAEQCHTDKDTLQYLSSTQVPAIYSLILSKCRLKSWRARLTDEIVLKNIAAFIRNVVTQLDAGSFQLLQTKYGCELLSGQMVQSTDIQDDSCNADDLIEGPCVFSPLEHCCDTAYISLFTPILCSGLTKIPIPGIHATLQKLCWLIQQPLEDHAHLSALKCLAGIINRLELGEDLNQSLATIQSYVQSVVSSDQDTLTKLRAVKCGAWTTKALVLRGHVMAQAYTDQLISLLNNPELGAEAGNGFHVIMSEYEDVMNRQMSAYIRLMYRQRFFMDTLPNIVHGFEQAEQESRKNYLLALSHLIQRLSKQVLIPELPKIFPLLMHSLLCQDIDLQLATMVTLGDLTHNAPELVHKHLDTVVPQLLVLATYKPAMKVRIAALKLIGDLTLLPIHIVMPYQGQVTRALTSVLDDKKRLVRAQAVMARQEWFMLGITQE